MKDIAAKHVTVRLGGHVVVSDFTANFAAGQITAVVGPNGAGKSTLLACLAGLRTPDAGLAELDGAPILGLPHRDRAQRIGFLPQTPEIAWAIDAETLVGLGRIPYVGARGLGAIDRDAVARALTLTGMGGFAQRQVNTLSGGERARVLIARALAGEPEWLLADEPLTGLDPGHQLDAAAIFRDFAQQGRGVIVTLHDLGFAARLADRVIVMADGEILADGDPVSALSPAVLARAYGIEARVTSGAAGPLIELVGRARG